MTVGFHSPLPPAATGVAEYAATLLAALRERGEVVPGARDAGVHLYHLGNNQLHREIYRRALEKPGVVVLHDAVLHHFLLGSLDREAYIEEFVYNYGEWHRDARRGTVDRPAALRGRSALLPLPHAAAHRGGFPRADRPQPGGREDGPRARPGCPRA